VREGFVRLIADAVGTVFQGYAVRWGGGVFSFSSWCRRYVVLVGSIEL